MRALAYRKVLSAALLSAPFGLWSPSSHAEVSVVTTIKPIHSLVAGVMRGAGTPGLLLAGNASPHTASLRPSQAKSLQDADVIFWVGPSIETFMIKPLKALGGKARTVALQDAPGLELLEFRDGYAFDEGDHFDKEDHEKHDHDEHGHVGHGHKEHAKGHKHGGHDHAQHAEKKQGREDHKDHENHGDHGHGHHGRRHHGGVDGHIWLDPVNARRLVASIAETLSGEDPANAPAYQANARRMDAELRALTGRLRAELSSVKDGPFVVFHDAYHYFERRFGLNAAGAVTISPEKAPSAKRLRALRETMRKAKVRCLFAEPQFPAKLLSVVSQETGVRKGVLDPLGGGLKAGPGLYPRLMTDMAAAIKRCLEA